MPRLTRRTLTSQKDEEKVEKSEPAPSGGRGKRGAKSVEPVEDPLSAGDVDPSPAKAARSSRGKEEAPKGRGRGRGKKEEEPEDEVEEEIEAAPPKRGRGGKQAEVKEAPKRAARGGRGKKEEVENEDEEEEEVSVPAKSSRGGRSKVAEEPAPSKRGARGRGKAEEEQEDEEEVEEVAPKRGGRGGRSKKEEPVEAEKPAAKGRGRSARGGKNKPAEEENEDEEEAEEENTVEEEVEKPATKGRGRSARGKSKQDEEVEEEPIEVKKQTPTPKGRGRGGRRGKQAEEVEEQKEVEEEKPSEEVEKPSPRGRGRGSRGGEKVNKEVEEVEKVNEPVPEVSPRGRKSRTPVKPEATKTPEKTTPSPSKEAAAETEVKDTAVAEPQSEVSKEEKESEGMQEEKTEDMEEMDVAEEVKDDAAEKEVDTPVAEEKMEEEESSKKRKFEADDDAEEDESASKKARVSDSAPIVEPVIQEEPAKEVQSGKVDDIAEDYVVVNKEDLPAADSKEVWFPHGAGFKKENQEVVCLPEPLPIPEYSAKIAASREERSVLRHRSEIIRETARFFLGLKYWWSSADYTRISELVVQQFPELRDDNQSEGMNSFRRIQRDLSMCARNLRRSKKPRRERDSSGGLHNQDPNLGGSNVAAKRNKASRLPGDKKLKRLGGGRSKKSKTMLSGSNNGHEPISALADPSSMADVNEDTEAATALLQQQFMQTSGYQHPSAHLLPSSHLLPSLHTHPALHDQQMAVTPIGSGLLQQGHPTIGLDETGKGLIKDEPLVNAMDDTDHDIANMKSKSMGKSTSPTLDSVHSEAQEVARALAKTPGRELDGTDQGKVPHPVNTLKVYQDPDHGNDLQERFAGLWRKGKFFDASLGVANKKLHVHKLVLLAMSPYLQETFKNADPRSQLEVNLPSDTTYETAKAFLKYIYEGILEVDTTSVRSLHKIATMLQMSKLAQYCQTFAQQLHEAVESSNHTVQGEMTKIPVSLSDFAELQRQKLLEAQAMQRLGDTSTINSSDMHQRMHSEGSSGSRYHLATEEQGLKGSDFMTSNNANDAANLATHNFLQQDALAQHRALIAATASVQSSASSLPPSSLLISSSPHDQATQQLLQATLARNSTSSTSAVPSSSSYHHHQNSQLQQQQQQQQHHHHQQQQLAMQNDTSAILHRLASEASSSTGLGSANSLDQQQRLALAAYWQAHAQSIELMSRSQVDPSDLTSEEQRQLLSTLSHEVKMKGGRGEHHSGKEWVGVGAGDTDSGQHQATMLPETCIPVDMARPHQVTNAEGT